MENSIKKDYSLSSAGLHIIAMALMLCDHSWSTLFPEHVWLTCLGRMTFPIFAFMIVEGFFHTHDIKKYFKRLFIFAVLSEVPFDLIYEGSFFYPFHQNVMWEFIIGLAALCVLEKIKENQNLVVKIIGYPVTVVAAILLPFACFTDYYGHGIMTILVFYFFHGRKWWCFLGQLIGLWYINYEVMGGYCFFVTLFGHEFEIVQQSIAVLALIPIWLYRGRQGYHAKWFQYFCYAFYGLHCAILYIIGYLVFA